ncbi:translesion error-prone DNA polymerase V autoproteolytic subunit [Methylotenera sp.]|uniref:LexA family protein n=1 Tax=Methylotenera sp. TaxID=2051956 RepID=UPI002488DCDA|nr:translesion error-prone DNA polymerase V autoproteolytic subunit [Methylotenera sp.]MDI1362694.1 translesion error-prone DNA polymerase V autoproteolytic subunit [Methylotenera sp.]
MHSENSNINKIAPRKNRKGAGRRIGTGKFREPTTVVRVPASQTPVIKDFLAAYQRKKLVSNMDIVGEITLPALITLSVNLPLYSSKVSAGFPSPAEEHVEKRLDPSEFLIDQKDATFFVTIQGYSMMDVGLLPKDKAVVDRSKIASIGDIVLAVLDGEFTIKTLSRSKEGKVRLLPANSTGAYSPIEITEEMNFEIWGVVTGSFRRF